MNWKGVNILITGGCGFIGSHLAKKMVDLGSIVHIADNFSRGTIENVSTFQNDVHIHTVDLTKLEDCIKVTKDIDCVFHLAASVGGINYIKKENVGGSTPSILMNTNMLESSRINDVDRFLFTSSACIYQEKKTDLNIFKESDAFPAFPHTTYGWAKLLGEIQCKAYYDDYGIKSSVVRIFNAYGENENLDPKWSHVIPSFLRKAILFPEIPFSVFGDGLQERAFLYVQDCVDGLVLSIENTIDAEPINLGSDSVISIRTLAKKIIMLTGKKIPIQYDLSGPQGTHRYCANIDLMVKKLSWRPIITIDDGLTRCHEWAKGVLNV